MRTKKTLSKNETQRLQEILARGNHREIEKVFHLSRPTLYRAASGTPIQDSTAFIIRTIMADPKLAAVASLMGVANAS